VDNDDVRDGDAVGGLAEDQDPGHSSLNRIHCWQLHRLGSNQTQFLHIRLHLGDCKDEVVDGACYEGPAAADAFPWMDSNRKRTARWW
jgi:hypothetical protein